MQIITNITIVTVVGFLCWWESSELENRVGDPWLGPFLTSQRCKSVINAVYEFDLFKKATHQGSYITLKKAIRKLSDWFNCSCWWEESVGSNWVVKFIGQEKQTAC